MTLKKVLWGHAANVLVGGGVGQTVSGACEDGKKSVMANGVRL